MRFVRNPETGWGEKHILTLEPDRYPQLYLLDSQSVWICSTEDC